jgi:ABC-type phosphate transport system ATPase subunit
MDEKQAIHDVSVDIAKNEVIAMIGPSAVVNQHSYAP